MNDTTVDIATNVTYQTSNSHPAAMDIPHFDLLFRFSAVVSSTSDLDDVFCSIHNLVKEVMDCDAFFVGLVLPGMNALDLAYVVDEGRQYPRTLQRIEAGIATETLLSQKPLLCNRTPQEIQQLRAGQKNVNPFGNTSRISSSIISCPIINRGKLIGVVSAQSYRFDAYTANQLQLLSALSSLVGVAIEYARLYDEQKKETKILALIDEMNQDTVTAANDRTIIQTFLHRLKTHFGDCSHVLFMFDSTANKWHLFHSGKVLNLRLSELVGSLDDVKRQFRIILNTKKPIINGESKDFGWLAPALGFVPKSLLAVPLLADSENNAVLLVANNRPMAFSNFDAKLYQILLSRLAIAFDRLRLLRGISAERDRLLAVLDQLGEGIHILDRDFTVHFANQWSNQNLSRDSQGLKCYKALFDFDIPCKNCPHSNGRQLHDAESFEVQGKNNRMFQVTLTKFVNIGGDVQTLEIVKDITKLKIDETENIQLERWQTAIAFAGAIAHELNQPLTGITGLTSLVLEDMQENDLNYQNVREIEIQAQRLRDLIQQFQHITWIEKMPYAGKDIIDLRKSIQRH